MAVEVERLLVTLEAKIGGYNRDLQQAQAQTNRQLAAMETRFAAWSRNIKTSASAAALGVGGLLGGIGAALGTSAVIEYANAWTRVTRAVDASGTVFGIALKPATELNKLANDARVDLDAYSKLYIRTSAAIRDYGFEAGTAETVTSTLAKALKLGGAAASEQASVLLQFSQALQKGKLDGDEFRSVMENAGVVQELLASRLGVTKGRIIELAAAGKLQIKDLVGAMVDGSAQVDRIFRQMPQTVDEAFAVLRNNFTQFIGQADQATGSSQALASAIVTISQNLDKIAVVAGAVLSSAAVRMAAFAAASVSVANPLTLIAATIGGLATAYGIFGDEVKISGDNVISLKDAFSAFLDIAGGYGSDTLEKLGNIFEATRERAVAFGQSAIDTATTLAEKAVDLDAQFGGYGAAIVSAFVSANKQLAETLGITTAINAALETGNAIADRAREIALAKGIEQNKLGGRLGDYLSGKITDPRKATAAGADPNAKKTDFEREAAQIRKRTAALQAELETINQTVFAQERAKAAAELRAALDETVRKRGTAATKAEIEAIDTLAGRYAAAQSQVAMLQAIKSKTDAVDVLRDEIALMGLYGSALTEARVKQELLNEAKRLGKTIDADAMAAIELIARQTAATEAYRDAVREVQDASKEMLSSFVSDMRAGVSATEALGNALGKLADRLVDVGLDQLITSLVGGATKPGTGFASLFGFADGGIAANGRPVPMKRFANGGISSTAAIFGEAGPEAAIPLKGGKVPVELRMPTMPKAAAANGSGGTSITISLAPVFQGGSGDTSAVDKFKAEVPTLIVKTVNDMLDRSPRLRKLKV